MTTPTDQASQLKIADHLTPLESRMRAAKEHAEKWLEAIDEHRRLLEVYKRDGDREEFVRAHKPVFRSLGLVRSEDDPALSDLQNLTN